MKCSVQKNKATCLTGALLVLAACGSTVQDEPGIRDTAVPASAAVLPANAAPHHHDSEMLGMFGTEGDDGTLPVVPPSAACAAIQIRLKLHRAALKLTPEWDALTKTEAWGKIQSAFDAWKAAKCKCHDASPSDVCAKLHDELHSDFDALKATPEYATAEQTDAWKTLANDYDDAKAEDCFKHSK